MADYAAVVFTSAPQVLGVADSSPAVVLSLSGGTPARYYQMEANDSITSALYTWVVATTPDWTGVGYPGPNAPVNVTISSVIEG